MILAEIKVRMPAQRLRSSSSTNVLARCLDIPNVDELMINYTFPLTIEDYVHRIARTGGRAGKTGGIQQQIMKQAGQEVPDEEPMKFGSTIIKKEHILYGNFSPKGGVPMRKAVKNTFDSD